MQRTTVVKFWRSQKLYMDFLKGAANPSIVQESTVALASVGLMFLSHIDVSLPLFLPPSFKKKKKKSQL